MGKNADAILKEIQDKVLSYFRDRHASSKSDTISLNTKLLNYIRIPEDQWQDISHDLNNLFSINLDSERVPYFLASPTMETLILYLCNETIVANNENLYTKEEVEDLTMGHLRSKYPLLPADRLNSSTKLFDDHGLGLSNDNFAVLITELSYVFHFPFDKYKAAARLAGGTVGLLCAHLHHELVLGGRAQT